MQQSLNPTFTIPQVTKSQVCLFTVTTLKTSIHPAQQHMLWCMFVFRRYLNRYRSMCHCAGGQINSRLRLRSRSIVPVHRGPHGGQLTEIMEHCASPQRTTWWTIWTANGENGGGASPDRSGTRHTELSDADMTMVWIWVCTSVTSSSRTTTTTITTPKTPKTTATATTGKRVAKEREND